MSIAASVESCRTAEAAASGKPAESIGEPNEVNWRDYRRQAGSSLLAAIVSSRCSRESALTGAALGSISAHRRRPNHPPTIRSDFDRTPVLIGEIEIDASGVLGGPDVDRALWAIELGARL